MRSNGCVCVLLLLFVSGVAFPAAAQITNENEPATVAVHAETDPVTEPAAPSPSVIDADDAVAHADTDTATDMDMDPAAAAAGDATTSNEFAEQQMSWIPGIGPVSNPWGLGAGVLPDFIPGRPGVDRPAVLLGPGRRVIPTPTGSVVAIDPTNVNPSLAQLESPGRGRGGARASFGRRFGFGAGFGGRTSRGYGYGARRMGTPRYGGYGYGGRTGMSRYGGGYGFGGRMGMSRYGGYGYGGSRGFGAYI